MDGAASRDRRAPAPMLFLREERDEMRTTSHWHTALVQARRAVFIVIVAAGVMAWPAPTLSWAGGAPVRMAVTWFVKWDC